MNPDQCSTSLIHLWPSSSRWWKVNVKAKMGRITPNEGRGISSHRKPKDLNSVWRYFATRMPRKSDSTLNVVVVGVMDEVVERAAHEDEG